jgi:hypothetical protein
MKDDFHCKATENDQLSMGDRLPFSAAIVTLPVDSVVGRATFSCRWRRPPRQPATDVFRFRLLSISIYFGIWAFP